MGRSARTAGWIAAAVLVCSAAARADGEAEAKQYFAAATAAYEHKDYRAAAVAFEESYRRSPRGPTLYNGALAWWRAKDKPRAADAFARALASTDLPASQRKEGTRMLAELEPEVAWVRVTGPAGATVHTEGVPPRSLPCRIAVAPGEHELVFQRAASAAAGHHRISAVAGREVAFELPAEPVPAAIPPAATVAEPAGPPPRSEPSASAWPVVGWTAVGAGVVAGGAGAYFLVTGLDARDAYDASGRRDAALESTALGRRTAAQIGFIAAGVLVAAGIAILVLAPSSSTRAPRSAPSWGGLAW